MNKKTITLPCYAALLLLTACGADDSEEAGTSEETSAQEAEENVINIGYQKFGTINFLKAEGTLDERLEEEGIEIQWTEFPAGPQLLEALNVGSIDFGHTGEAPPIFAQAAGAPLVYAGNGPASPESEALIVQEDSDIETVQQLKGKKVALNRGSNVHYLLVQALAEADLSLEDIEPVYLPPAEARTAFDRGDVDAWVIWDPFLGAAEDDLNAEIIRDGEGIVANREFLLADESFAAEKPEILDVIFEELDEVEEGIVEDKKGAAEFLSPQVGIEEATLEKVLERKEFGVEKPTSEVIQDQQVIADTFHELDLVPEEVLIQEAIIEEDE